MGIFSKIKGALGKPPAKEVAKQRLQVILKYDRAGLPPNAIEEVKKAILAALEKFPFIDTSGVNISIPEDKDKGKIEIEIPVKDQ
ncbi:cell division topological specificity factor MinE [Thermovibrio ammonificans]|jgi:cell division topological specificity factor|uniref:Cell division topological specificity factor n=1 Tax=Thermovibrio ammonificans (strain DSM 15698 / JCM 12110 / HB-1) TaxID=648996 RepID=E8T4C5_THEA1|nr:cell division topological specificity factor MinE [Thermovibrio ammonificans]ADU96260.1 cell division topological specificity factor MinE [Thermovibrio ammonificans HB-1]